MGAIRLCDVIPAALFDMPPLRPAWRHFSNCLFLRNYTSIWGFIIAPHFLPSLTCIITKKGKSSTWLCVFPVWYHLKPSFVLGMAVVKDDKMAPGVLFLPPAGVWSTMSNSSKRWMWGKSAEVTIYKLSFQYEIWVTLVSSQKLPRRSIHITVWDVYRHCEGIGSWQQCVTPQAERRRTLWN